MRANVKSTYWILSQDPETHHIVEFIQNRFYFVIFNHGVVKFNTPDVHYFQIDDQTKYTGYYSDFGPLHIGEMFKYCSAVDRKLRVDYLKNKAIVHYTVGDFMQQANNALLAGSFAVLYLHQDPVQVWENLTSFDKNYPSYRDASLSYSMGVPMHTITILDCLQAIQKARQLNFFDFNDFEIRHYEAFQVDGYSDLNWIVPDRLVALSNPSEDRRSPIYIDRLVQYFTWNNVGTVVRLNYSKYNSSRFSLNGIRHINMQFEDGTPPPQNILEEFLSLAENTRSAIAVHCKAGLGRTGCLIGAYLMKHYRLSSLEAIAWMRICRPAMVIGSQQAWLMRMQKYLWSAGDKWRVENLRSKNTLPAHARGIYNKGMRYQDFIRDLSTSPILRRSYRTDNRLPAKDEKRTLSQGDFLVAVRKYRQNVEKRLNSR